MEKFPGVEMRNTKLAFDSDLITASTFQKCLEDGHIEHAVRTLMPAERCTVMGISCTSMSFTLGPEVIDGQLKGHSKTVKTTDMARAQAQALQELSATKIALVTPYIEDVSLANVEMLKTYGIEVVSRLTMDLDKDELTSAVAPASILEWAVAANCPEAEAIVIGCSALRACEPGFIDDVESATGKPVVTSTQAFMWRMLRLAGVHDNVNGYGTLFSKY